jgi:hypothetical protein
MAAKRSDQALRGPSGLVGNQAFSLASEAWTVDEQKLVDIRSFAPDRLDPSPPGQPTKSRS